MCPFFEKRIKGLKEFKLINDQVLNSSYYSDSECRQRNLSFSRFLDLEKFSAWIIENKVIDFIFKENAHAELIRRSFGILKIMA